MIQQKVTGLVFQREEKADELSAAPFPITLEQHFIAYLQWGVAKPCALMADLMSGHRLVLLSWPDEVGIMRFWDAAVGREL